MLSAFDVECQRAIDIAPMQKAIFTISDTGRPDQVARRAGARLYRDLGIQDSVVTIQDITDTAYVKPMKYYTYRTSLEPTPTWDALPKGMPFQGKHRIVARRAR